MPTTEAQQRLIESYYDAEYAGYRRDEIFAARVRDTLLRELAPLIPPGGTILDVGCGGGEFLAAAQEQGFEVSGIDVSEAAALSCQKRGIDARAGDFLTMTFTRRYHLVTMWDVVEHLREPKLFLERALQLLEPGGYLVLKIPAFEGLTFLPIRLYNRLAHNLLGAPAHVQYFTQGSLEALLRRTGFAPPNWFPSRDFRSAPRPSGWKSRAARTFSLGVKRLARNRNLYVAATPAAPSHPGKTAPD